MKENNIEDNSKEDNNISRNSWIFVVFAIVILSIFLGGFIWIFRDKKAIVAISIPSKDELVEEEGFYYLGMYPQQEIILGTDALSRQIENAIYDGYGDAVVGELKIRRVSNENVTYPEGSIEDEFHYFLYYPLRWRVLVEDDSRMLMITEDIIDCRFYQNNSGISDWINSDIHSWLNNYFYEVSFSPEEKELIQATRFGNVFLLSQEELSDYILMNPSFVPEDVLVSVTDYAKCMGAYTGENDGDCWWYLRFDETENYTIRTGSSRGVSISAIINHGQNDGTGIRPILIIRK